MGCHPAFLGGSIAGLALVFELTSFTRSSCSERNAMLGFQRATQRLGYRHSAQSDSNTIRRGFLSDLKDGVSAPKIR